MIEKKLNLKKCPFCGSDMLKPIHLNGDLGYIPSVDYVACMSCSTVGPKIVDNDCFDHLEQAIEKWNTRSEG